YAGWSATTGPTERPPGRAARRGPGRRGPAGPTPHRGRRCTRAPTAPRDTAPAHRLRRPPRRSSALPIPPGRRLVLRLVLPAVLHLGRLRPVRLVLARGGPLPEPTGLLRLDPRATAPDRPERLPVVLALRA